MDYRTVLYLLLTLVTTSLGQNVSNVTNSTDDGYVLSLGLSSAIPPHMHCGTRMSVQTVEVSSLQPCRQVASSCDDTDGLTDCLIPIPSMHATSLHCADTLASIAEHGSQTLRFVRRCDHPNMISSAYCPLTCMCVVWGMVYRSNVKRDAHLPWVVAYYPNVLDVSLEQSRKCS